MAEPTKNRELEHIKMIGNEGCEQSRLLAEIGGYKKKIEDALSALQAKREALLRTMREQEERQREIERIEREKEEEIRKAASTPIIESTPEPVVESVKEEIEATEPVVEIPEQDAKADTVEAPAAQKEEKEAVKSDAQEKARAALKENLINTYFEKPKKTAIEKPVIRKYIPPVEEQRPQRRPAGQSQSGAGGASRPSGPRPQSNAGSAGTTRIFIPSAMPTVGGKDSGKKRVDKQREGDKSHNLNKKSLVKKGYESVSAVIEYDEISGEIKKVRTRKVSDKKKDGFIQPANAAIDHAVIPETITIKALSEKIGKTGTEIMKKLFILGIMKSINDNIDFDTADLIASEFGITLEKQHTETSEEKLLALHEDDGGDNPLDLVTRPPIVTIMGHVDHGKTSILDYIRKANVAAGEAGGITQHIGAYSIQVNGSPITFLDTPGHEAFTAMRARGANVTDIVVIVVAADDGIMPQTIEAINHSKAAGVGIIVAINKIDRVGADPDRILTQLTEHELLAEEWGGTIPVVRVSAKTGQGIEELLENILLSAEMMELKANPTRKAKGTIVEARLDKGKGPVATILVQNGTLKVGDWVVAGTVIGKVRAMIDDKGRAVAKAGPSMAVSVLGLQEVPNAGDQMMVVSDEKLMKQVAEERRAKERTGMISSAKVSLDDLFKDISEGSLKNLNLIVKADVQGSVEAIKESLIKLSTEEVKVSIVHAVAGAINESDVTLADTTNAIIIGFNVRPDANAKALAERNKIDIRLYRVIYDAIDDVNKAIKGLSAPKYREQYLGKAEVRVVYKISGVGNIAGAMVKDGKIVRNAKVRLIRNNIVVADTAISSLKRMKDDVKEVVQGFECGIGLENFNDLKEGDIIESFNVVQENE